MSLGYDCFGVPLKGENLFPFSRSGRLRKAGIVPHSGRFLVVPRVLVRTRTGKAPLPATYWRAVLATASRCVEGYHTPDEAMVC